VYQNGLAGWTDSELDLSVDSLADWWNGEDCVPEQSYPFQPPYMGNWYLKIGVQRSGNKIIGSVTRSKDDDVFDLS